MLSKIKLWLSVAGVALIAGLMAMLKIKSARLDKAKADVDKLVETNKQNKKVGEIEQAIKESVEEVGAMSNDDTNNLMHKYDRNRKGGD